MAHLSAVDCAGLLRLRGIVPREDDGRVAGLRDGGDD